MTFNYLMWQVAVMKWFLACVLRIPFFYRLLFHSRQEVEDRFVGTGANGKVKRIQRVQNRTLWTFYFLRREQVAVKNHRDPNEKYLFHGILSFFFLFLFVFVLMGELTWEIAGSRTNAYDTILKDGFDHRVGTNSWPEFTFIPLPVLICLLSESEWRDWRRHLFCHSFANFNRIRQWWWQVFYKENALL